MGKPTSKNKKHGDGGSKSREGTGKQQTKSVSQKALDEDMAIFITMSQEIKEEGNKLFKERDHEGAMLKYEKAVKLLPKYHIDVAYLHSSMAACYMQMGTGEYTRAISECNLAIDVAPKYSKALLNRARCYEALNRLDLARSDVDFVLGMEPNNLAALDIMERVKNELEKNGIIFEGKEIDCGTDTLSEFKQVSKEKVKKSKNNKANDKKVENKVVFKEREEKVIVKEDKVVTKTVKLVFGEDIRWAQLPAKCSIGLVRDIVRDRFPNLKGILLKYIDHDGDFVTITTTDELRLVDTSSDSQSALKLYIVEVSHEQEPFYEEMMNYKDDVNKDEMNKIIVTENREVERSGSIDNDIQFARLFKNHVGFNSDSYVDLHDSGMKLYSEAMEDTVTNEEAQELFGIASEKFQEMAALALFSWGNVHMSKAKKCVLFPENDSKESILAQIKTAYEWAEKEYVKAGMRYEEAIKIKPDFYEGLLALGLQQFEQAKLVWYYAVAREKVDLEHISSTDVLNLYNKSEDSMEMGMQIWEEMEEQRLNGLLKEHNYKSHLQNMGFDGIYNDISAEEAAERAANMRSQIYLLWGTLLYERSIVEFKLELPTWQECLEVAVEKFELAGASQTDLAVMIKNHCSNETALKGIGFKIDEIVQAWNEMYDAKRWETGVPSFRLEPLFRRRVLNLYYFLEYI